MIQNQWYVVLSSDQVKNKPVGVTRLGEKMVFWRTKDTHIHCMADRCIHRGASLSKGQVKNNRLQCPFHGFEYNTTGKVQVIPANGKSTIVEDQYRVKAYECFEKAGFIWVWWNPAELENPKTLQEPEFFSDFLSMEYGQKIDPWNAHYSRVIENQLDVVHLPFVHYNTIGRGNKTVVDGPIVKWMNKNRFKVFVHNQVDKGQKPLQEKEIPLSEVPVYLDFIFPNLWQNHISDTIRVSAAFVPVDENNTLLYLRYYMKKNFFSKIAVKLSSPSMLVIAHQDRRIVETQIPKKSSYKSQEKLIKGDSPIVNYRKRRNELKAL